MRGEEKSTRASLIIECWFIEAGDLLKAVITNMGLPNEKENAFHAKAPEPGWDDVFVFLIF